MLRERLKEMDLRITELAEYLQVSRPTMYKFIELYDNKKFGLINRDVLALFNYINENELVGKKGVMNFILTQLTEVRTADGNQTVEEVKNYLLSNPQSKKSRFIADCFLSPEFNDVICYLADIAPLLKKKNLNQKEKSKLKAFNDLKKEISFTEEK